MKIREFFLPLVLVLCVSFAYFGCSNNEVPDVYKQGVVKLKGELENMNKIPLEKTVTKSEKLPDTYTGIIDYRKRAEYINKNRRTWDEIIKILDKSIGSGKLNHWHDDALFCKALVLLTMASVEYSNESTDSAISSMNDFIEFNQNSEIQPWTKIQLKIAFWDRMGPFFSESLSEKRNLDAFFHIGIASLLEKRKTEIEPALAEYEKVLEIDPHGLFGQQARGQIELLKTKLSSEPSQKSEN